MKKLTIPTFNIFSMHDEFVSLDSADYLAGVRNYKLVILEKSGHFYYTQEERTKITFSVTHNEQLVDRTYVPENTISPGLSYTFITGIETDSYGHITKIITSTYKWN